MTSARIVLCAASLSLAGCAVEGGGDGEPGAPRLTSVSRDEVRVGERLEFLADDLVDGASVRFAGEFEADDGSIHAVDLTLAPERAAEDRLVIPYFGPYQVPFGDGDRTGRFTGTVAAVAAGVEGAPLDVELRVAPSIIVRELASEDRFCPAPSTLLLGGGTLHLAAEAIGLDATELEVRLGDGAPVLAAGGVAELPIPPVPDGALFTVTELSITARGAGDAIASDYLIGVHRALEYIDLGRQEKLQIEDAIPVSGCYSGGQEGQSLTFGEQAVDLRSRSLHFSWNQTWLNDNGQIADPEVLAEVGLRHRIDGLTVGPDTDTWTVGYDAHERAVSALAPGPNGFWEVSSGDMLAGATAEVPKDEFGVWYRQASRIARPGTLVERNACGEALVAAESMVIDYLWDVDLATAAECPPFPLPDLPAAACLAPPCD
ncbi:MAG TPA: hypothetical protein VMZ28_17570 [Kofleriaceae bacterium]|nr:hypothetical protein [Kofleriaceae bacterium]